jgi:hypothetical protein
MAKEKRKMRIQCANRMKRMFEHSKFRQQVKSFTKSIKILKLHMLACVNAIR